MVKAIIDISDKANRMLMVVKAQYNLRDKSEAIDKMAEEYEALVFEQRIRPSYMRRLKRIQKEPLVYVGSLKDFRKRYNLD